MAPIILQLGGRTTSCLIRACWELCKHLCGVSFTHFSIYHRLLLSMHMSRNVHHCNQLWTTGFFPVFLRFFRVLATHCSVQRHAASWFLSACSNHSLFIAVFPTRVPLPETRQRSSQKPTPDIGGLCGRNKRAKKLAVARRGRWLLCSSSSWVSVTHQNGPYQSSRRPQHLLSLHYVGRHEACRTGVRTWEVRSPFTTTRQKMSDAHVCGMICPQGAEDGKRTHCRAFMCITTLRSHPSLSCNNNLELIV